MEQGIGRIKTDETCVAACHCRRCFPGETLLGLNGWSCHTNQRGLFIASRPWWSTDPLSTLEKERNEAGPQRILWNLKRVQELCAPAVVMTVGFLSSAPNFARRDRFTSRECL